MCLYPPFHRFIISSSRGTWQLSLPQVRWITHVGLIPFTLSVVAVRQTCSEPSCAKVKHTHTHTQAQVPVFDKDHLVALASSTEAHHDMGNPLSSHDFQFALITTTWPKALSSWVTMHPQQLCVRDHRLVHTLGWINPK